MSITFACGSCGKSFTVDDKFAGKKGRCKQCNAVMSIPELVASAYADDFDSPVLPPSRAPMARALRREPVEAKAPALAPKNDVYGFDDEPMPARSLKAAPGVFANDDPEPVLPPRPGLYDPIATTKKKQKRGGGGFIISFEGFGGMLALRIIAGITAAVVSAFVVPNIRHWTTPGFMSKGQMESHFQKHLDLTNEFTMVLKTVRDVPTAQEASPRANAIIRAITAHLRFLKDGKGLQTDIDAMIQRFRMPMEQATNAAAFESLRIGNDPNVVEALDIEEAIKELAELEKSLPNSNRIDAGNFAPRMTPPAPAPPPFVVPSNPAPQPNPGLGPRPGPGRRGRPNFGRPPG